MNSKINVKNSARRHFRAAEMLFAATDTGAQPGSKAVAGYLFGVAGEMAVKQIMLDQDWPELPNAQKRDDPYYAHFPDLKTLLQDLSGRRAEKAGEARQITQLQQLEHEHAVHGCQ